MQSPIRRGPRLAVLTAATIGLGLAQGCGHTVRYRLGPADERVATALPYVVGVEPLAIETSFGADGEPCNRQDRYSDRVQRDISVQVARHLDHVGVFSRVVYLPDEPDAAVDLLLRGTVKQFEACVRPPEELEEGATAAVTIGGVLGLGLYAAATSDAKTSVRASVAIEGMELVERATGGLAWRGAARGAIDDESRHWSDKGPFAAADRALKEAVASLASNLAIDLARAPREYILPAGVYFSESPRWTCRRCPRPQAAVVAGLGELAELTRSTTAAAENSGYPFLAHTAELGLAEGGGPEGVAAVVGLFAEEWHAAKWLASTRHVFPDAKLIPLPSARTVPRRRVVQVMAAADAFESPAARRTRACAIEPGAAFVVEHAELERHGLEWAPVRCSGALAFVERRHTRLGATVVREPGRAVWRQALRRTDAAVEVALWEFEAGHRTAALTRELIAVEPTSPAGSHDVQQRGATLARELQARLGAANFEADIAIDRICELDEAAREVFKKEWRKLVEPTGIATEIYAAVSRGCLER